MDRRRAMLGVGWALAVVLVLVGLAAAGVFDDRRTPADKAVNDLADSIRRTGD